MRAATKKLPEPKVPLGLMYHDDPYLNEDGKRVDHTTKVGQYLNDQNDFPTNERNSTKVFCITRSRSSNYIPNNAEDVKIENLET